MTFLFILNFIIKKLIMNSRMQDSNWSFSDEDMEKLYPDLTSKQRSEAAHNLSEYFQVVARIFHRLQEDGMWMK